MTIEKLKKKRKKELACRRALLNFFFFFLKKMFLHAYSKNINAFQNSPSFLYRSTIQEYLMAVIMDDGTNTFKS